ncbi:MAG: type II toxin-antitoxin system HicB family antitoxin [Rhodomicrobium sp.]|nr:type II toxin-antitoxin system HicB family antitoxin [Rhodomicrobium sp.]
MTIKPDYSVLLRPLSEDDGSGWIAIVPDLPGCYADGATAMEALESVSSAIRAWIATAEKHGRSVPKPDDFINETFPDMIPLEMRQQAEIIARQMQDLQSWQQPDNNLLQAIYAEMARATIRRAHL